MKAEMPVCYYSTEEQEGGYETCVKVTVMKMVGGNQISDIL